MLEAVIQDGDLATIRQPLDFYGVNYYNPMRIARRRPRTPTMPVRVPSSSSGYPTTDFGWPVVPDALREWLITPARRATAPRCRRSSSPSPAAPTAIGPDENGVVDDQPRIDYLDAHLRAVADAVAPGRRRPRLLHAGR